MIDAKPISLIWGIALGLIAPEHATVVCNRWKLTMPSTFSLVISCARAGESEVANSANKPTLIAKNALIESSFRLRLPIRSPIIPYRSRYWRVSLRHRDSGGHGGRGGNS